MKGFEAYCPNISFRANENWLITDQALTAQNSVIKPERILQHPIEGKRADYTKNQKFQILYDLPFFIFNIHDAIFCFTFTCQNLSIQNNEILSGERGDLETLFLSLADSLLSSPLNKQT